MDQVKTYENTNKKVTLDTDDQEEKVQQNRDRMLRCFMAAGKSGYLDQGSFPTTGFYKAVKQPN